MLMIPAFLDDTPHPVPCRTQPDVFFERDDKSGQARRACRPCPVREGCLAYALARPNEFGVWGGKTRRERLEALRSRGVRLKVMSDPDVRDEPVGVQR